MTTTTEESGNLQAKLNVYKHWVLAQTVVIPILSVVGYFILGPGAFALLVYMIPFWIYFLMYRKREKIRRLIEVLPTSTIRSVASGLVKVEGRIHGDGTLYAPLNDKACAAYRYVEQEQMENRFRTAERVEFGSLTIDDGTGVITLQDIDGLDASLLPLDFSVQRAGCYYHQYVLEEGEDVLIIGEAFRDGKHQNIRKSTVYDAYFVVPKSVAEHDRRYKRLFVSAAIFWAILLVLVVVIMAVPMALIDGGLVVG